MFAKSDEKVLQHQMKQDRMFVDDKNQRFAIDRKHSLANQLEMAANLHRRMGLPFLPQTLHSKFIKGYTTVMKLLGIYGTGATILVMIIWILLALSTSAISNAAIGLAFVTIFVAGYVGKPPVK